jgi:hypothetical protein
MRAAPQRSVHDFGRIAQHVAGEVGIALRGAGIAVPEQRLHHVERDALIDEKTRKRVPQIVQPQVLQSARCGVRGHGNHNDGHGRPVIGDGKT